MVVYMTLGQLYKLWNIGRPYYLFFFVAVLFMFLVMEGKAMSEKKQELNVLKRNLISIDRKIYKSPKRFSSVELL